MLLFGLQPPNCIVEASPLGEPLKHIEFKDELDAAPERLHDPILRRYLRHGATPPMLLFDVAQTE